MIKEIDVRGLSCPQPVMMVKKAIDTGETDFLVVASDSVAIGNIQRLAENNGFNVELQKKPDGDVVLNVKKR